LFSGVHKRVSTCNQCQAFEGNRKFVPLPLKPISIEVPFQQCGPNFVGEIYPSTLAKHKLILIASYYFTNWIEAITTRQAIDIVIIQFLEVILDDLVRSVT